MNKIWVLALAIVLAGCSGKGDDGTGDEDPGDDAPPPGLVWDAAVPLQSPKGGNAKGYEPSIASDSTGVLYYTAHKELTRPETWAYPASWMFVSRDQGKTWGSLTSPVQVHEQYAGDEGDIAIDGRDYVYFLDTYLADNHLHTWKDNGKAYVRSGEQHSTQADDRPWLAAQGNGVLHYLGNNGVSAEGLRYTYYRSTDEGQTWSVGEGVPNTGWSQVAAERKGDYAYIASIGFNEPTVKVQVSPDQGVTWGDAKTVVSGKGCTMDEYPIITVDEGGTVYIACRDGSKQNMIFFARSTDHGKSWDWTRYDPLDEDDQKGDENAFLQYVWIDAMAPGVVGIGFYGVDEGKITDGALAADSEWYVYGGIAYGADGKSNFTLDGKAYPVYKTEEGDESLGMPRFNFTRADPDPVYVGGSLDAQHDFMEVAVGPRGDLNVAYHRTLEYEEPLTPGQETTTDRELAFARGVFVVE